MRLFILFLGLLAGLFLAPINSHATYAPSLKWHTIETTHFLIHYHTGLKSAADEVASLTKDIHDEVTTFFNWVPKEKTHIVISDKSEKPNGSASILPYNRIELFMSPPADVGGLEDYQNWKKLLLKHEYVHIVHLDKAADLPLDGRSILGRYFLFFPNTFSPRWISEGIATFFETDLTLETGRGQSNYYRGLMRNELIQGFKSLNQISQPRTEWPSGAGIYLYGVYFFNFIQETYGKAKIAEYVDQYSHFPAPYFVNTVAKNTFGKNMFELWDDFELYLNEEFRPEIKAYEQAKNPTSVNITNSGFFSGFSQIENNKLYFIRSDREKLKELVELDLTANSEKIISTIIKQDSIFPQSFDVHPQKGILIPLLDNYENFRQSFDLYKLDPKTGHRTRLTTDRRYIRAVWNKQGENIIALHNSDGKHRLDLLNDDGELIKTLWVGAAGVAINAIDWSPVNNTLIVSLFTPDNGWNLTLFNIDNLSWRALTNNASIETYPQFDKSGEHIIYSADYNGIYNSYQLNIASKDIIQLNNSGTVSLFPTLDEKNNMLYVTELGEQGFNLKLTAPQKIEIKSKDLLPQTRAFFHSSIYINEMKDETGYPYAGVNYLSPTWILPQYSFDENQMSFGVFSRSNDPLSWHTYQVEALYDVKNLEFRWNIGYSNQKELLTYTINSRQESFNSAYLERRDSETSVTFLLPYIKQSQQWQVFTSLQKLDTLFSIPNSAISLRISDYNIVSGISLNTSNKNLRSVAAHDGVFAGASYEVNKIVTTVQQHSRILLYAGAFSSPIKRAIFQLSGAVVAAGNNARVNYLGGTPVTGLSESIIGTNTFTLYGYALNQFINTNLQKVSVKFRYPLFYPDIGFFRLPIAINRLKFNAIAERARVGTFNNINTQEWLDSVAVEISTSMNFGFGRYPFNYTAGIAKGLNNTGERIIYQSFNIAY